MQLLPVDECAGAIQLSHQQHKTSVLTDTGNPRAVAALSTSPQLRGHPYGVT